MTKVRYLVASCLLLLLAACGSTSTNTPSASPSHTSTPSPTKATPTPTPAPDKENVEILNQSFSSHDLITVPIVMVKSDATQHSAIGVYATFITYRNSKPLFTVKSPVVNIGPGQIMALAGSCVDPCQNTTSITTTLTVTSWGPPDATPVITASNVQFAPNGTRATSVTATLTAAKVMPNALVISTAVCHAADGSINGGGTSQNIYGTDPTYNVTVAAITNSSVSKCEVYASYTPTF